MKKTLLNFFQKKKQQWENWLSNSLSQIVKALNRWDAFLTHYAYNPNPKHYEDLAPSKNIYDEAVYTDAISWALRNQEIKNIAITGTYGSGKSSLIKSFENCNKQYHYLNISLATFNDDIKVGEEQRRLVETSILQQLFYQVKDRKLPDSRFKRIKRVTKWQQTIATVGLLLWLLASIYLFKPEFFERLSWYKDFEKTNSSLVSYTSFALFFLGIAITFYFVFRLYRNKRFSKVNLATGEFELAAEETNSILNKHLDEILYFFEVTSFNVIIIEDLDRFNDPEIFTKLREINTLLNQSKQINRRVVFIYAVRDDMFLDKSRTKFFDFIIPIIPVINSSNSVDILLQKLSSANLNGSISLEFISDITLYIEDMRMLKNVVNEYIIYKDKIGTRLNQDKLLAMIIYKNLYPNDFAALHVGKGKVYSIIGKKEAYIRSQISNLDERIKELGELSANLEKLALKNIEELRSVYLLAIVGKYPQNAQVNTIAIEGSTYDFHQAKEDGQFFRLIQAKRLQYYHYGNNNLSVSFKDIEAQVDSERSYLDREREIRWKETSEQKRLADELSQLNLKKARIQEQSLSEILQTVSDELIQEIRSEKLLVYLLRYGYIDEGYYTYISYFYEGSITKEDNDFLLSVKNHEPKPFGFKLTKMEQLLKKLRLVEFETPYVFNFGLVDFLLNNKMLYSSQSERIFSQISAKERDALSFLDAYISEGKAVDVFMESLSLQWNGLWAYINAESGFSEEKKDVYLTLLVKYATVDSLQRMNMNQLLTTYISKKKYFFDLIPETEYQSKIKQLIKKLDIRFEDLQLSDHSLRLLDFVYRTNHYCLNPTMITLILRQKCANPSLLQSLEVAHYTTIQKSECELLIQYINENLEQYINNVFLVLPNNTKESEETIIRMLGADEISEEIKEAILQKQETILTNLNDVNVLLWDNILLLSRMQATWANVLTYFVLVEILNETMLQFLNLEKNYKTLAVMPLMVRDEFTKENVRNLSEALLLSQELSQDAYVHLLGAVVESFEILPFGNLPLNKVNALLDQNKLILSVNNFQLLREKYSPKQIVLVEANVDAFIDSIESFEPTGEELALLLRSDKLTLRQKGELIKKIDDGLLLPKSPLVEELYRIGLLTGYVKIPTILLEKLIPLLSTTKKVKLLTSQMQHLSLEDITRYLLNIGVPYESLTTRSNPLFENNELNLALIQALNRKDYISSFNTTDDSIRVYTKQK